MKYRLSLALLLFVTSCAIQPAPEQNDLGFNNDTIQQAIYLDKTLDGQALQQLEAAFPQAYALYEQARSAESQGQLNPAIALYHKALQQAPEHGLLLSSLGMAYLRNEDIIPARRYLLQALNIEPDDYKSRLGLGYIYLQNRQFEKASRELEISLQLLPTLEGIFLLGETEAAQGNLSRARQLYQTVVAVDKNSKLGITAASRLRSLGK